MMRHLLLYCSGILSGEFELDLRQPQAARCRLLDPSTATLSPWHPFSDPEARALHSLTKMDLPALFSRLGDYATLFSCGGREVFPPWGEHYLLGEDGWFMQRDVKFPCNLLVADGKVAAIACPCRESVSVLVEPGYESRTPVALWTEYLPQETLRPVEKLGTFSVLTRDGVSLSTNVFLPADRAPGETFPTILIRTPYGKEENDRQYYRYIHRGYAVAVQDVRGRSQSGGAWEPNLHEVEDGDDTLNWIAAQPWSDGQVGMTGGSYLGMVQWAAAASGNPHLKAMVSVVCAGSPFVDFPRRGGTMSSGSLAWSFAVSQQEFRPELMDRPDWDEVLSIRPLRDIPKKALGYDVPFLDEYWDHPDYDGFWRQANWSERYQGHPVPALIQSGWFDDNGMGTTEALDLTEHWPAGTRKVILGPWQHSGNSRYDLHGLHFGPQALRFDLDLLYEKWFDHFLRGWENGVEQGPPVEYYSVGSERWKTAARWPVEHTRPAAFYLQSGGYANTSSGDGILTRTPPEAPGLDTYHYNPQDPGTHIIDMAENEIEVPENYTQEEQRPDYLCYTTPPLDEPLTLTGDFTVRLWVSSDAPDTDFMVRICDVFPDGTSMKLADGILSARYRQGFTSPVWLEEGQVVPLAIRTTKLSNTFLPGHRLRLTITSGAKNFAFPHSNTKAGYDSTTTCVAQNQVHHGGCYLSCLEAREEC